MNYLINYKNIAISALLGTSLIVSNSIAHEKDGDDYVKGEEVRALDEFDSIVINGSADVNVEAGKSQNVLVTSNADKYLPYVETEVRGRTLYISQKNNNWHNVSAELTITVQDLNNVAIKGSGDVVANNFNNERFEVEIRGSGDVTLSGSSDTYDITIKGSGDVDLNGTCENLTVRLQGSGDLEAENLECKTAKLTHQGSGDIDAFVSDTLEVQLGGSGDVTVYGSPKLNRLTGSGSGDFELRNKE